MIALPEPHGPDGQGDGWVYVNPADVTGLELGKLFWRGEVEASRDYHTIVHLRGGGSVLVGTRPEWVAERLREWHRKQAEGGGATDDR